MILLKTEEDIALMRQGALILSQTLGVIAQAVKPGVTTKELDKLAETYIGDQGGIPSFKGYNGFPASLCVSVNEEVVHGIPSQYALQEGDIVSIDAGVFYKGFHNDSAYTFPVGDIKKEAQELLKITKEALYLGIAQAVVGKRVGDIGAAIEEHVLRHGYSVVKELAGHGIGRFLHEDPQVLNYSQRGASAQLKKGMVLAIEPMVNQGKSAVKFSKEDGWTVTTADRQLSAHFEHTVAVGEQHAEVLTTYRYIEKN
jgi:methionyl aminopeptidase